MPIDAELALYIPNKLNIPENSSSEIEQIKLLMKARFTKKPLPKTIYDWIFQNFCLETKLKFSYNNLISRYEFPT